MSYPRWKYRQSETGAIESRLIRSAAEDEPGWENSPAGFAAPPAPPKCQGCTSLETKIAVLQKNHVALATAHEQLKAAHRDLLEIAKQLPAPAEEPDALPDASGDPEPKNDAAPAAEAKPKRGRPPKKPQE